jgi:Ca2+:H+ antiporter
MSISAVMLHGANNPTLVRDTLMGGDHDHPQRHGGCSLLAGGWRHREQQYNLQGANAYLSVIIPLAVLGLVLPNMTQTTLGPDLSGTQETFLILMSSALRRLPGHPGRTPSRAFSCWRRRPSPHLPKAAPAEACALLAAYMRAGGFPGGAAGTAGGLRDRNPPCAGGVGGLAIAVLVATPEAIGATKRPSTIIAARDEHLPGIGACDHRPDHSRHAGDRPSDGTPDHPGRGDMAIW